MEVWIAAVILENLAVVLGGIRWSLSLYPVPTRRAILTPAHKGAGTRMFTEALVGGGIWS